MRLPWLALFALLLSLPGSVGLGAGPVRDRQVEAELVAETTTAVPGQTLWVALRLRHDPGWHTYWQSSTTGYATSLTWQLPEGVEAGPIQWPVPRPYALDFIVDYVYDGEVLLPVALALPADWPAGQTLHLRVLAEWLMCEKTCVPGQAELSLEVPVAAGPPAPHPVWGSRLAAARQALPRAATDWRMEAWKTADRVLLRLLPEAGARPPAGDLYFFSDNALLRAEVRQNVRPWPGGGYLLELPLAEDGPADAARLTGVLRAAGGWGGDPGSPGLLVAAEFRADPPPALPAAAPADAGTGSSSPPTGAGEPPVRGLLGLLGLALVGGLILNLMPCVFPVLGIKVLGFVNQAGEARSRVVLHGLAFTAGVLMSFWALSGLLLALRAGGEELGWGFQLQSPGFVYFLTLFLFLFALNLSGLFEVGQSAVGVGGGLMSKQGLSGSFFSGVLATVVSTPCAAPFLAPALGAALALPALASLLVFTAIGVGLSLPYLTFSAFPGLVRYLPRPGAWMETFKQLMAFPLYATVGYLIWVLAGQVTEDTHGAYGFLRLLFALVLVALAGWVYGRWTGFDRPTGVRRAAQLAALLLGGVAVLGGLPRALPVGAPGTVSWEKWSPERVHQLVAEGRPVYVDFTARWCATCQTNKAAVFSSRAVLEEFARRKVATLKGDWTNRDPAITAELARHGRSAVPFNLLYLPGRVEPLLLPEVLTPGTVLQALEGADSAGPR